MYAQAYGVRNLDTQEPLQVASLFHLVSVTKLFVSMALLQAQNADIGSGRARRALSALFQIERPADTNEITVRQTMTDTSGMPDTDDYGWDKPEYDDGAYKRYVRSVADLSLIANPNEKYFYSNIAYEGFRAMSLPRLRG